MDFIVSKPSSKTAVPTSSDNEKETFPEENAEGFRNSSGIIVEFIRARMRNSTSGHPFSLLNHDVLENLSHVYLTLVSLIGYKSLAMRYVHAVFLPSSVCPNLFLLLMNPLTGIVGNRSFSVQSCYF